MRAPALGSADQRAADMRGDKNATRHSHRAVQAVRMAWAAPAAGAWACSAGARLCPTFAPGRGPRHRLATARHAPALDQRVRRQGPGWMRGRRSSARGHTCSSSACERRGRSCYCALCAGAGNLALAHRTCFVALPTTARARAPIHPMRRPHRSRSRCPWFTFATSPCPRSAPPRTPAKPVSPYAHAPMSFTGALCLFPLLYHASRYCAADSIPATDGPRTTAASPVTNWSHQRMSPVVRREPHTVPAWVFAPVETTEERMAIRSAAAMTDPEASEGCQSAAPSAALSLPRQSRTRTGRRRRCPRYTGKAYRDIMADPSHLIAGSSDARRMIAPLIHGDVMIMP